MTDVTADKHIIEPRNPKFDTRFFLFSSLFWREIFYTLKISA